MAWGVQMCFLHSSNFSCSVHQNSSGKMSRDLVLPFPLHPLFHLFVSLNSLGDRRIFWKFGKFKKLPKCDSPWYEAKHDPCQRDFPQFTQPDLAPRYHLPVAQRSKGQYHLFLAEMLPCSSFEEATQKPKNVKKHTIGWSTGFPNPFWLWVKNLM